LQGTLLDKYDPAKGSIFNLLCGQTALRGHVIDWFKRLTKLPESQNITESGDDQETSPMEPPGIDIADGLAECERDASVEWLDNFYRELPPHQQIIMQYRWFDECPEQKKGQLADNLALVLTNRGLSDQNGNPYTPTNIRQIITFIQRRIQTQFQGHME